MILKIGSSYILHNNDVITITKSSKYTRYYLTSENQLYYYDGRKAGCNAKDSLSIKHEII